MTDVVEVAAPGRTLGSSITGSVSPHWEVYGDWGDHKVLDEFRARVLARLVLLPRDDPQFRRNRERIVRDAERELITIEWDLGRPDDECIEVRGPRAVRWRRADDAVTTVGDDRGRDALRTNGSSTAS